MNALFSRLLLVALALSCTMSSGQALAQRATIAAASDQLDSGKSIQVVYGSSGNFYRQLREGAPFQMFLSADEAYIQQLVAAGLTEDEGVLYALGRIVIITPHGSTLKADAQLQDLSAALVEARISRFAIANPEHAPYGERAEEALRHAGLWDALQGKLVYGENVSQAAQFATSGNAQGGIIAYSLALAPKVSALGEFALIPQEWHQALRQRMVLLKSANADVRDFYAYLQSAPAREIMQGFGFALPKDH
jgi:molybdate transport system substrate-binding protein